ATRLIDYELDHLIVLVMGQGRRLAGRAARHDTVDARLDFPFNQVAERGLVDCAVAEGSDDRRYCAAEHCLDPPAYPLVDTNSASLTSTSPVKTSTASPVMKTWPASGPRSRHSISRLPPRNWTIAIRSARSVSTAATCAAHAPVPQASVSPEPRSHTRIRKRLRESGKMNS